MEETTRKLVIAGQTALVDYKRGTGVYSALEMIRIFANLCAFCERSTDRFSATYRDGRPWKAIPCCDECHENLRKLPSRDQPLIIGVV